MKYFLNLQIAILTAKWRPDFGRPLSPTDVLLAEDVTKEHKGSAVILLTLKGIISAKELRVLLTKNVIEHRHPKNPKQLQFPELKQYQTKHLGFIFYRNDPDFKIENYIHPDVSQQRDPDFRSYETILETVSYRPYPPKRSAWEMFVLPNYKDPKLRYDDDDKEPKTLVVLRIHHTQIDGYSLLSVLITGLGRKASYVTPKPKTLRNTEVLNVSNPLPKFIEGFVNLQKGYLHNMSFKRWLVSSNRNPQSVGKVHHRMCPPISKDLVKKIAQRYDVRIPAVLMAIVTQNLERVMSKSGNLPSHAFASYGIPMPNHPGSLSLHV
ncbi:unnamed protein product [Orchesella dallaii]|uniref:Diacylglycerol O-acyltransferase n=1 Tax=Orchesella dallaii TaxID=48710 RepID=A0ABP1RN06_9HEXA